MIILIIIETTHVGLPTGIPPYLYNQLTHSYSGVQSLTQEQVNKENKGVTPQIYF